MKARARVRREADSRRDAVLTELGAVERGLMAAMTVEQLAAVILPAAVQLFGAVGAALLDEDGTAIAAEGSSDDLMAPSDAELEAHETEQIVRMQDGCFARALQDGWLLVRPDSSAPPFGTAELQLLDRIGSFADLALQRCRLFEEQTRLRRITEATNAELQTIIYSVSHDLRNPIISVLGYLDVLAREHHGELSGEGEHYLQRISVNALYMQNLIQDLLELSRIGRSEPPPQAVALGDLAESVAQELRAQHPDCVVGVDGTFPVIWMSELRARQLLTNLMDNAAKYRGTGTRITVSACRDDVGGASVAIADDGLGIAPHLRDKAFDVFERLDAARTDVPGTGMGLPICKRIVETLGGEITLGDPPADQETGTTATIGLPKAVVVGWAPVSVPEKEHST